MLHRFSAMLSLLLLMIASPFVLAQPATQPVAGEKNNDGLTATLVAQKTSYVLDPAQSGKAFLDKIIAAGKQGIDLPKPPAVDLSLVITNTSNQNVTLTLGGDASHVLLDLAGPGALTVDSGVMMTEEFRMGMPLTLTPGSITKIRITSLASGTRGLAKYAYWTQAGDYTLTATLVYSIGDKQGKVTSGKTPIQIINK